MTTKSTSFRLSTSTLSLLKQLADSENRSLTNMVETLIQDKAKEKGMDILFRLSNKLGIPEKDLELLYFDNSGVPSAYKHKPTGEWSFIPK